ncbi:MAG: hypothetical protein LBG57_08155 [Treponema sp.]|jgi:hypothetical protein|nr:hypothetical protein [Treponema sp.]
MRRKPLVFAIFFLVFGIWVINAQNTPGRLSSGPFVSGLRAETRNNLIRLTWADSDEARGPVYIFRSTMPFGGDIPQGLEPVEIAYGIQSYIDEFDGSGTFYYFVAASASPEQRHDIVIPDTNTVMVIIEALAEAIPLDEADTGPLPELGISGLAARVEGEAVIVTYNPEGVSEYGLKKAVLYRSGRPIRRPQDLLNASIVLSGVSSPFVDYPIPGLPWFYAVLLEDDITGGSVGIYPGRNATRTAVEITGGQTTPGDGRPVRSLPLPAMSVHNAVPGSDRLSEIPDPEPLSRETLMALESVTKTPAPPPPDKKPRVFTRDLAEIAGGEDSELMLIVQNSFSKKDWRTASEELSRYLSLPRSADTEARARFYLGQTCYFSGKYREALVEFLYVRPLYPNEAHVWIEATLSALTR